MHIIHRTCLQLVRPVVVVIATPDTIHRGHTITHSTQVHHKTCSMVSSMWRSIGQLYTWRSKVVGSFHLRLYGCYSVHFVILYCNANLFSLTVYNVIIYGKHLWYASYCCKVALVLWRYWRKIYILSVVVLVVYGLYCAVDIKNSQIWTNLSLFWCVTVLVVWWLWFMLIYVNLIS